MEDNLSKTLAQQERSPSAKHGNGRWKTFALASLVPLGLLFMLWFVFKDQLVPAIPVSTARVTLMEQNETQTAVSPEASEMMFQASGWIEPEPWRVDVAVKVNGYVEQVFVKEGEAVTNGQLLATLDDTDARLALELSDARRQRFAASLTAATQAVVVARKQAETGSYRVEAALARVIGERDTWERFSNASPGAVSQTERVAAEQAKVEFEAEEKAARAALAALEAKVEQAEADVRVAQAALAAHEKECEMARVELDRTQVHAAMDGIVLKRHVNPGDKRMAQADDSTSAMIVSLYNPANLQVRVDVPIAEAGKIQPGQPAKISSAMLPGQTFNGRVLRIIGQADIQRNTLQAKVAVEDPDPRLRPEVLCRVEFWSPPSADASASTRSGKHSLWVPKDALTSAQAQQTVWVVDPLTQRVEQRNIQLYPAERDGYRQIADGLRANERIVTGESRNRLTEGHRVKEIE